MDLPTKEITNIPQVANILEKKKSLLVIMDRCDLDVYFDAFLGQIM